VSLAIAAYTIWSTGKTPFLSPARLPRSRDGFSGQSVLNRHMKTKHTGTAQESTSPMKYRCLVSGCKYAGNRWSKLDKLRTHLERARSLLNEASIQRYMSRLGVYPIQPLPFTLYIRLTRYSSQRKGNNALSLPLPLPTVHSQPPGKMSEKGLDSRSLQVMADSAASAR
jgi:hypothetical protein